MRSHVRASPRGYRVGGEASPASSILCPLPAPSGVSGRGVSLREGENQPPQAPHLGRALTKGGGGVRGALSLLLSLAGCSGSLRRSLGHYARLAGLWLAAWGARARWDAGTAAGRSPLPPLLSRLVKQQTTCLCAWKTEAWLTVLFKNRAWPPCGRVMRRCNWDDKGR